MTESISYSDLRERLKSCLDQVCSTHQPLRISRRRGEDVVILSWEDFAALEETAYLLRSPANAARLLEAAHRPAEARQAFTSLDALNDALDR